MLPVARAKLSEELWSYLVGIQFCQGLVSHVLFLRLPLQHLQERFVTLAALSVGPHQHVLQTYFSEHFSKDKKNSYEKKRKTTLHRELVDAILVLSTA